MEAKQATLHHELIAQLLDSRIPKTEREHAAAREIERLRADILQELADAPEAEPFAVIHLDGSFVHVEFKQTIAGTGKFEVYATPTPAESPADVVRDAERYRWLLKQAWFQQAADRFDLPDGGLQNRFEKCMDEFIDAAIERQGGE